MINLRPLFLGMLLASLSQPPVWSQTDDLAGLRERAEQGNSKAQTQLGYYYHTGDGVERDYAKALKWYRLAAEQGNVDAQYNLGVAYAFGEGANKDLTQASDWYQRAAEQGHKVAAFSLGLSYLYGDGVRQDGGQAATWFRQSAEQGYTRAQVQLASIYHTGEGVPQDYEATAYWYRQAAERGHATAQYNLGKLYRAGRGVPKDNDTARHWFGKAADQDYVLAKAELESLQQRPDKPAMAKSADDTNSPEPTAAMPAMETDMLTISESTEPTRVVSPPIEAGKPSAGAANAASPPPQPETADIAPSMKAEPEITGFADMIRADKKTAQSSANNDRQAAGQKTDQQHGDMAGFFGSLFGDMRRGESETAANAEASQSTTASATADTAIPDNNQWREPVAEQPAAQAETREDSPSSTSLALKGDPATSTSGPQISDAASTALASENYAEAVRLLQQQALNGNAAAETRLASLYSQGRGVEQSYDRALLWYRRAAKRRFADAQYNLGSMYLLGEGVLQSDSKARDWYAKAAAQGHEAAANNLANLKRRMANQQRYNPDNHAGPTQQEMQNASKEKASDKKAQDDTSADQTGTATPQPAATSPTASRRIVSPPLEPTRADAQQDGGAAPAAGNGNSQKQDSARRRVSPPLETSASD